MTLLLHTRYDDLNRLALSTRNDSFYQSWNLDGLGNFNAYDDDGVAQTRVNLANEIQSISGGWANPDYDRAGNMDPIPAPTDVDLDHSLVARYDAWNRLMEVSDDWDLVARFSYDGLGRRLAQFGTVVEGIPQTVTHYFHSGQQVIQTRDGSPATDPEDLLTHYENIWSPRYVDALVLRDEYIDGAPQTAARLYYLSDANYNVTALVGKVGSTWQVRECYAYSAYGQVTIYTPDWLTTRQTSLFNNTTLYTGRELDPSTNLYYYRARYYSADLGVFVGRDPIEADSNLYRYVGNNPVLYVDPSGQYPYQWQDRVLSSEFKGSAWDLWELWWDERDHLVTRYVYISGDTPFTKDLRSSAWFNNFRDETILPNLKEYCCLAAQNGQPKTAPSGTGGLFPPGWNPGAHACANCHSPEVQAWQRASDWERQHWNDSVAVDPSSLLEGRCYRSYNKWNPLDAWRIPMDVFNMFAGYNWLYSGEVADTFLGSFDGEIGGHHT